ncbi:TRAP transporter permease [Halalkalicoccus jeotgali]|uniref:C4-dicarboxylate anaerobic carrier n=1 Tax=Halalkalicoccus jeotgali (strain DSM 18796 / CECT 7217 / JCM 14584 / KCTC 4019 / B3) TaxID=795797 RepID=D8JCW3_HALJB|nr:TRAP transporter fused permease subunit [Halalkalicoccus jeotgali]ADJ16858.1 C4-dicarboxylate anaerobic carrier [Halalkalicoccus jeotgali B3]ELY38706.1 C4-dicarboxylate anaerobic carrier [Halalkalicoccus jeotgali B3]
MGKYIFLVLLGIAGVIYHLWFALTYGIEMQLHLVAHLGFMMVAITAVCFDPQVNREDGWLSVLDNYLVLPAELIGSAGIAIYLWMNYERLAVFSIGVYTDVDFYVGIFLLLFIIDQSRRAFGNILPAVGVIGLIYAIAGPYFPSILRHGGIEFRRLITSQTVAFAGVYDTLVQVAATYIVIFIVFAAFLEAYGAMNYFVNIGAKVGSYVKSGITQTAVVTSVAMGSVNGSAAANAATTGAFTIPLMKNQGISKETSAAIESVASSGGQIMPPIMGAAAFVMAEITGTSYLHIITIGLLPALLFYGTIAVAVHLITLKEGAGLTNLEDVGSDRDESKINEGDKTIEDISMGTTTQPSDMSMLAEASQTSFLASLAKGMYLWLPVSILVYTLVILQYDPVYAGFFSTLSIFPVALLQGLYFGDDKKVAVRDFVENTIEGCRLGMSNAAPITLAVAVIAIFVGVLNQTGFTQALAQSLISLSGGELALLLFFAMFAAILFGLGMPTVAAYIVAVLLIAPALVNLGVRLETAHFFVFYFAILSAITPPVAIACIITAEISKGNFWRVAAKSLVIGMPLFLLPYVFIMNDAVMYWEFPQTLVLFPMLLLGLICLSIASIGYLNGDLSWPFRIVIGAVGFGILFVPVLPVADQLVRMVLVAIAGGMLFYQGTFDGLQQHLTKVLP